MKIRDCGWFAVLVLLYPLSASQNALADSFISVDVSLPCSNAQTELARVKDLPLDFGTMMKGDLTFATIDHYVSLMNSSDCSCAAVESMFPRSGVRASILQPSLEPLFALGRLALDLPQCTVPPDLVIATGDCISVEIQGTLEDSVASALRAVKDPRVKALLQDSVVRGQCVDVGDGKRAYRAGVWRHGYGNRATLKDVLGTGKLPEENLALHVTTPGLRNLLAELAPTIQSILQDHMLNLVTKDARSLHLDLKGQAVPGDGAAAVTIKADIRILGFETQIFQYEAALSDTVRIETVSEHDQRLAEARSKSPRIDIPIDSLTLRCNSSSDVSRGIDIVRVFATLFVSPTLGPGIAGGIDWLTSRTFNDELANSGISGAICGLVDNLPARAPVSGVTAITVDFTRALADQSGLHLYGSLGLARKEPSVWLTKPLALSPKPLAGTWLVARARDLLDPKFTWLVVSGSRVADADTPKLCGRSPGGEAICILPTSGTAAWVTVTGHEANTTNTATGTYFSDGTAVMYCSALGCTDFF